MLKLPVCICRACLWVVLGKAKEKWYEFSCHFLVLCCRAFNCTHDLDCVYEMPSMSQSEKIACLNGTCLCLDCFTANASTGHCQLYTPCFDYDPNDDTCIDLRQSQTTAFILSLFLSSIGAANFYIGQYVLGGTQLGLLLTIFLLCYSCTCCVCFCCGSEPDCLPDCCQLCDEEVSGKVLCTV